MAFGFLGKGLRLHVSLVRGTSVAVLALACMAGTLPGHTEARDASSKAEAVAALQRLDSDFFDAKAGLYRVTGGQHEPYAALWPTSQALNAAISVASITRAPADLARVRRIIDSLHVYLEQDGVYHARTIRSLRYYDDNNWIALDMLDAYGLLHDPAYLANAQRVFAWLVSGWDSKHGGGILWADGHPDRPTVSTAPAITIALRLAAITHKTAYRTWAERLYAWENTTMRDANGLYWDHIDGKGMIDRDIVSYNQGAMIDANVAYVRLTNQGHYMAEARRIAAASAKALPGPFRDRGNFAAFNALYFQALGHLNDIKPGAVDLAAARNYVAWAWPLVKGARSASHRTENDLLEQAAFVITAAAIAK